MCHSRWKAGVSDPGDRSGPECRKVVVGWGSATLRQDIPATIGPERSSRASANRKRPHSISRVF